MLAEKLRMGDVEIPNIYQNRGIYASWVARNDPDCVQYDKNGLAWVKNMDDGYWCSFSNNLSED